MQFRVKQRVFNRDAATKKMKRANEDQEETDERRKMPFFDSTHQ